MWPSLKSYQGPDPILKGHPDLILVSPEYNWIRKDLDKVKVTNKLYKNKLEYEWKNYDESVPETERLESIEDVLEKGSFNGNLELFSYSRHIIDGYIPDQNKTPRTTNIAAYWSFNEKNNFNIVVVCKENFIKSSEISDNAKCIQHNYIEFEGIILRVNTMYSHKYLKDQKKIEEANLQFLTEFITKKEK